MSKTMFMAMTPACKEMLKDIVDKSKQDFNTPPDLDDYSNRSTVAIPYGNVEYGYAIITPLDDGGMWLAYLWIREDLRCQGIGQDLMRDIKDFCNGKLSFYCRQGNDRALKFYKKCGFKIDSYLLDFDVDKCEASNGYYSESADIHSPAVDTPDKMFGWNEYDDQLVEDIKQHASNIYKAKATTLGRM